MSGTLHTQPHPEASCLVVTLENPGKRNAIDAALWRALGDLFTELAAEGLPWRSVILTGAGDAFAAGVLHAHRAGGDARAMAESGLALTALKHSLPGDASRFGQADIDAFHGGGLDVRR